MDGADSDLTDLSGVIPDLKEIRIKSSDKMGNQLILEDDPCSNGHQDEVFNLTCLAARSTSFLMSAKRWPWKPCRFLPFLLSLLAKI